MEETVMQIKDMFRKKIDREIQGVIIVGQGEETNVAQELEEYVVTRELQRHFADFFAAYKKGIQGTTPKMGVWISGFFGSGKSHFLKILSYLLQNKQVGDKHAIDRRKALTCSAMFSSVTCGRFIRSINLHPWRRGVVPNCSNTGLINAGFIE